MNRFRTLIVAILALFAQVLLASPAHAGWLRGETKHFVIYSSGSAKQLQKFGANLERFNALLQLDFKVTDDNNPTKLVVYFLATQDQVARLAGDKSGGVAGFYSPRIEGSFAVANRQEAETSWDLDGMNVLFHEYGHHFMARNFTFAYPGWYTEGFAEFLSTATFDDKGIWTIGKPANHRAYSLLEGKQLPIDKLLFGSLTDMTSEEKDSFYGRSWALVHMFAMRPEYRGRTATYFTLIQQGKTDREAAVEAFGDLAELDKALDKYVKGKLSYAKSNTPITADIAMNVTVMDKIDGQLVSFTLDRLIERTDAESIAKLRQLAAANPARAPVWYELALAEREMAKGADAAERKACEERAEAATDKVLAIDPNHVRANVLKANIVMRRLHDAGDDNPARWSAARKYLVTANTHAVDDPLVLVSWYQSFVMQGKQPSKVAHDALARAFELQPEVVQVRVMYALDLAEMGEFDAAIHLVKFLALDPHHAEQGKELLAMIERMRTDAQKRLPPPAPAAPAKPAKGKGGKN